MLLLLIKLLIYHLQLDRSLNMHFITMGNHMTVFQEFMLIRR